MVGGVDIWEEPRCDHVSMDHLSFENGFGVAENAHKTKENHAKGVWVFMHFYTFRWLHGRGIRVDFLLSLWYKIVLFIWGNEPDPNDGIQSGTRERER